MTPHDFSTNWGPGGPAYGLHEGRGAQSSIEALEVELAPAAGATRQRATGGARAVPPQALGPGLNRAYAYKSTPDNAAGRCKRRRLEQFTNEMS